MPSRENLMTTPDTTAEKKYYALMIDDASHFDCFIEADSQDELIETCEEYIQENPTHKILFVFHGTIIDLQNTIEKME